MINLDWLSDRLVEVLQWQLANPGRDDGPEVPYAGLRVWSIFLDLNATRGAGGFGPAPISYAEIEAWSRMRREPVRPFEMDIIRSLDAAYLKAAATGAEAEPTERAESTRAMTPELFDAIFG